MGLDGLRAEPERPADALVRTALGHQRDDLPFTRRERGHRIDPPLSGEQLVDNRSVDDALTGRDPLNSSYLGGLDTEEARFLQLTAGDVVDEYEATR